MVAAAVFPLLWWTLHGAVGTEHAAIPWLGPQQLVAIGAFMEEAADVRGSFFERGVSAVRAGQQRVKDDRAVLHGGLLIISQQVEAVEHLDGADTSARA